MTRLLLALAAVQQCVLSVGAEDDLTDLTFEEFAVKFKKNIKTSPKSVTGNKYLRQIKSKFKGLIIFLMAI